MAAVPPLPLQPVTAGMRRMLYLATLLVLIIGVPLFLLTEHTDRYFAWTIQSPLTAAFLGAAYWASGVLEFLAARQRWWARARSTVIPVLIFTSLMLLITLLHLDRFHLNAPDLLARLSAWGWLVVYVVVPVVLLLLLVRQWQAPGAAPARQLPLPLWLRGLLGFISLVTLAAGLLLVLLPNQAAPVWPWALTTLTARALGAWCLGLGLMAAFDLRENDAARVRPIRAGLVCFSLLQLLALARYPAEPAWGRWSMWLYLLFLALFLLVGLQGLLSARRAPPDSALHEDH